MAHQVAARQQLQDAFELFTQVSEQLSGSYQALQQRVVSLDEKLLASGSERQKLLAEIHSLRQEVNRSQRLSSMGEMTARLAHQIRTPLSTALLYASQLKQQNLRTEQHDCFVDRLLVGLRHLDHMVNDMLVFARGGTAGDEFVSLQDLLDQVYQALSLQLQEQEARWAVVIGATPVYVRGQREVLASAFTNMATNAMNACGKGACIDWECTLAGEFAVLRLQDNGPGVPSEICQQIFEPFFTTYSNGTGLGLAVVRAVIDAHGGNIQVDPDYRDGARFVIRLPLAEARQQLPSEMLVNQRRATKTVNLRNAK